MSAEVTNLQEFSLSLKKFQAKSEKQAVAAQGKITFEILRGVVKANPVDTGRMRAAWTVGVGAPPTDVPAFGGDIGGGAGALSTGAVALTSLKLGQPTFVVNNVEYSGFVEQFHPTKSGFVKAVVANVQSRNEAVGR